MWLPRKGGGPAERQLSWDLGGGCPLAGSWARLANTAGHRPKRRPGAGPDPAQYVDIGSLIQHSFGRGGATSAPSPRSPACVAGTQWPGFGPRRRGNTSADGGSSPPVVVLTATARTPRRAERTAPRILEVRTRGAHHPVSGVAAGRPPGPTSRTPRRASPWPRPLPRLPGRPRGRGDLGSDLSGAGRAPGRRGGVGRAHLQLPGDGRVGG